MIALRAGIGPALIAFCVLLGSLHVPARAQTPGATPQAAETSADAPKADEIRGLIETLENDEQRKRLLEQLRVLLAAQGAAEPEREPISARLMQALSGRLKAVSVRLSNGVRLVSEIPAAIGGLEEVFTDPIRRQAWIDGTWTVAGALATAAVLWLLAALVLRRPRRVIETQETRSTWAKATLLLTRTALDVLPIAAFAAGGFAALTIAEPGAAARLTAVTLLQAVILAQLVLALARACFAPRVPALRLLPTSDENAYYAFIWVRRFTVVGIYGWFAADAWIATGLPAAGYDAIATLVSLTLLALTVILVLQVREAVARQIAGSPDGTIAPALQIARRRLSEVWHVLAVFYVVAAYLVWELRIEGGFALIARGTAVTLVTLYAATLVLRGVDRFIERALGVGADLRDRFPELEPRANRYFVILKAVTRVVVAFVAIVIVLESWGIDSLGWLGTEIGRRIAGTIVTIVFLIALSIVVWELASAAIHRYLARASEDSAAVSARAKTLLPLLRTAILVTLAVLFVLVALSEIGLDIAPLLAGAGVIGIAIGFGAQTLFKDIITGLFILTEDQIAIGDVVRVDSHGGLVEGLTIRTMKLRDLRGVLHIIPYSEVRSVENLTKEYGRYLLEVGVAYREDPDEVMKILVEIGDEMLNDPYYGPLMLEPVEVLGVDRFDDSAVVIRARLTTLPIKQWEVGREFNRRMKHVFDARGIEIPFPHRTLYFGEDKHGRAPVAHVRVAEDQEPELPEPTAEAKKAEATPRYRSTRRGSGGGDNDG